MRNNNITKALTLLLAIIQSQIALSQINYYDGDGNCEDDNSTYVEEYLPGRDLYDSRNGSSLSPHGEIRFLMIFIEFEYDVDSIDPFYNKPCYWCTGELPPWADDIMSPFTPIGLGTGSVTRYYQYASSNDHIVLGDYLLAPNNGGVFKFKTHDGVVKNRIESIIDSVNNKLGNSFLTENNLVFSDFDKWTPNNQGLVKTNQENGKWDMVAFIFRNATNPSGNKGYGSITSHYLLGHQIDQFVVVNTENGIPTTIIRHEYAHKLVGSNNYHTAGGGWGSGSKNGYWITRTGGWALLGLYGSSLMCWNAWDRYRLGWKGQGNTYDISARKSNGDEINGDLKTASDSGIYVLRDFVTTGDAIRIKLPYVDASNEYEEWIWLENHQGVENNGNEFDQWQYQGVECVEPHQPGLMAYLQINNEKRQSAYSDSVFGQYRYIDYILPLVANGFWDRDFDAVTVNNNCVSYAQTRPFIRLLENPLTGGGDQCSYAIDTNNSNTLTTNDLLSNWTEMKPSTGTYYKHLYELGHSSHVFTPTGNKKIGIGTNPSSATIINMVGGDSPVSGAKNLRRTLLNGISIEILEQCANGDIKLRIRFDDVDVDNNVRWCSDSIVLNPINTTSGYSLNLKQGKQIILDQGLSATRMTNPMTFNGQKVFASPTTFTVMPQAKVHMEQSTNITLKSGSKLHFKENSACVIEKSSSIEVQSGTIFQLDDCALLEINGTSKLIVRSGAELRISPNAILAFKNGNVNIYVESGVIIPNGYVNPSTLIPNTISNKTISTNTTWSGVNKTVNGKITINNRGCLNINSSTLQFLNDSCGIIVKAGGKLIIDGSTLTNYEQCYNSLWAGIQVWGDASAPQTATNGVYQQGYVELKNGATIENAVCALDLWKPNDLTKTGGIAVATDANFINNAKSVRAMYYVYVNGNNAEVSNKTSFSNCSFVIDEYYLGTEMFHEHAELVDVKGITFSGCSFDVFSTLYDVSDNCAGIRATDANFDVSAYFDPQNITLYPTSVPSFSNFHSAINTAHSTYTQRPFNVSDAVFTNNTNGIYAINSGHPLVSNCEFNIPNCGSQCSYGIYVEDVSNMVISDNDFVGNGYGLNSCGIGVKDSPYTNTVNKNSFTGLAYGNKSMGLNYYPQLFMFQSPEGLKYTCNTNNGNTVADFHISNVYGNLLGGVLTQGASSLSAGNTFSASPIHHIYNSVSGNTLTYYYDTIYPDRKPTANYYVDAVKTNSANTCSSGNVSKGSAIADYEEAEDNCNRIKTALEAENDPNNIEVLEAELAFANHQRLTIIGNAVREILMDSISDINEVRQWLNRANTPSADRSICATYLSQGDYETALDKATAMIEKYAMEDETLIEQTEYISILKLQRKVETEGRVMEKLNSEELGQVQRLAENGTGVARSMAKAIMMMNGMAEAVCDCNSELAETTRGNEGTKADAITENEEDNAYYFNISPVPAKDYIIVSYNLPTDHATLKITNNLGMKVRTVNIEGKQGKKIVSLAEISAGVYTCTIQGEGFVKTEKIVITK